MKLHHTIQYLNGGCFGDELQLSVSYYHHEGDDSVGVGESVEIMKASWRGVDVYDDLTVTAVHNLEEQILDERKGGPLDRREDDK